MLPANEKFNLERPSLARPHGRIRYATARDHIFLRTAHYWQLRKEKLPFVLYRIKRKNEIIMESFRKDRAGIYPFPNDRTFGNSTATSGWKIIHRGERSDEAGTHAGDEYLVGYDIQPGYYAKKPRRSPIGLRHSMITI